MTVSVRPHPASFSVMREWQQKEREIERNFRVQAMPKLEEKLNNEPLELLSHRLAQKASQPIVLAPITV